MNKEILVHLKSMKMRDMKVSINTNGLLMNKKMSCSLVDIGVDSISVSIDATTPETLKQIRGVTNLEKIVNNINQLLEIRGDDTNPRIGVSFTKQEGNLHEVNEFVAHWIKIVDFVRVGEIFEEGRFPAIELDRSERKPCPDLYTTMAIHNDGEVSICCLDGFKDHTVGNVFEEGVVGVWNGEKLNQIREYHETGQWDKVPFCKNCDRWASEQFVEEELDGLLIRKSPEFTFYNRLDRMNTWKK